MTDIELIDRFAKQMKIELAHNAHKGSIVDFTNFDEIVTQLEYHKAKFFVALRLGEKDAAKEYLADCGNILAALGNSLHLFDKEPENDGSTYELNRNVSIIKKVNVNDQSSGNQIVN